MYSQEDCTKKLYAFLNKQIWINDNVIRLLPYDPAITGLGIYPIELN